MDAGGVLPSLSIRRGGKYSRYERQVRPHVKDGESVQGRKDGAARNASQADGGGQEFRR